MQTIATKNIYDKYLKEGRTPLSINNPSDVTDEVAVEMAHHLKEGQVFYYMTKEVKIECQKYLEENIDYDLKDFKNQMRIPRGNFSELEVFNMHIEMSYVWCINGTLENGTKFAIKTRNYKTLMKCLKQLESGYTFDKYMKIIAVPTKIYEESWSDEED